MKEKQRNVILAFILIIFSVSLSACSFIRCKAFEDAKRMLEETDDFEQFVEEKNINLTEIGRVQKVRAAALLEKNGLTEFTVKRIKRHYNYTAEDYRKMEGLDESYLSGFYKLCDEESFAVILKALEYKDLDDFLVKNGYVDESGNPDHQKWYEQEIRNTVELKEQGKAFEN